MQLKPNSVLRLCIDTLKFAIIVYHTNIWLSGMHILYCMSSSSRRCTHTQYTSIASLYACVIFCYLHVVLYNFYFYRSMQYMYVFADGKADSCVSCLKVKRCKRFLLVYCMWFIPYWQLMYYAELNLVLCTCVQVKLVTELSHKFYHACVCVCVCVCVCECQDAPRCYLQILFEDNGQSIYQKCHIATRSSCL